MLSHEIVRRLKQLRAILPSQQGSSSEAVEAYVRALGDVPEAALLAALDRAERELEWFPTPAALRRLAAAAVGRLPAPDRAGRAWAEVVAAIPAIGAYRSPTFADPLTAPAIARIGGWAGLCGRPAEWLHDWGRRAFLAEFASLAEHGPGPGEPLELAGLHGLRQRPARTALPPADGSCRELVPPPPEAVEALQRLGLGAAS